MAVLNRAQDLSNPTGTLFVIATPIGNMDDISARAITLLGDASLIAAEDTRRTGLLLSQHQIKTRMIALHDHNEAQRCDELLDKLLAGANIALVSDAGTPLISDPGFRLVQKAHMAGVCVSPVPGACAAVAALSAAGLATDRFSFEGFLPAKMQAKLQRLEDLETETRTLIFYEAPHRVSDTLLAMQQAFGPTRAATCCREITKKFEEITQSDLAGLHNRYATADQCRGEFVIVVSGNTAPVGQITTINADILLKKLTQELPPRKAAKLAAEITGLAANELYKRLQDL